MNGYTRVLRDRQDDRSSRAQRVIGDCMRRRTSGESLSDERVIASHPDLMPELGQALCKLALIQEAVREARESSSELPTRVGKHAAGAATEPQPDSFPGYEITGELHRGGQGVVYRAIQKATRRKVAIKVMKEGRFAGPADRARFDREVHILGQLDHPNIVTIHDSGEAAGHFYYAMDYITGRPLDQWIAEHGLGIADSDERRASGRAAIGDISAIRNPKSAIDQTLRLFAKICDAVNAAHLRGIIHRDLKPGNIRIDADGEPRILDFGLAKVAAGDSEAALMTMTGQFVGSLPWASPEQAEGSPSKIDVRTDVYSLGVILYQMLTNRSPYPVSGNMRDVVDNIMKTEPVRPSTIRRQIDDEVETIVLKCLAKERERRYQTGGELARDIRHYLAGEPIEAKRDSLAYMLGKQLRRYKLPAMIAAAFVVVVTVGFITSLTFWRQAVADRAAQEDQRRLAEANAQTARQEAAKAEAVNEFLQDMLASVDPSNSLGREVRVREVLDEAAWKIADGSLDEQPDVEAAVRLTIGATYEALGLHDAAEPHLRAALEICRRELGGEHPDVATSLNSLAVLRHARGDYAGAEPLYREALALSRKLLGDEHPDLAHRLTNLASLLRKKGDHAGAESLYREALAIQRGSLPPGHPHTVVTLARLGRTLVEQGRFAEAEPLLLEGYAGPAHDREVLERIVDLYEAWGKPDEAAEYRAMLQGL